MLEEAYQIVPELTILADIPIEARIHRLTVGLREAWEEMTKLQLELNLHIIELRLKVQPSIPLEVIEQCASAITLGLEDIGSAIRDYTRMLEESFEVLTNLLEDPNI